MATGPTPSCTVLNCKTHTVTFFKSISRVSGTSHQRLCWAGGMPLQHVWHDGGGRGAGLRGWRQGMYGGGSEGGSERRWKEEESTQVVFLCAHLPSWPLLCSQKMPIEQSRYYRLHDICFLISLFLLNSFILYIHLYNVFFLNRKYE